MLVDLAAQHHAVVRIGPALAQDGREEEVARLVVEGKEKRRQVQLVLRVLGQDEACG